MSTTPSAPLRLAIIGAAGRGAHYSNLCTSIAGVEITAVCDLDPQVVERCQQETGASEGFTDYDALLRTSSANAVIIATPMPLHARQSIAALKSGRHVLCEVTAATDLDECRALRATVQASDLHYMMAENYGYQEEKVLITEMVRQGLFGETYYAEGAYLHDIKDLIPKTPWRRTWQVARPGNTYPTHSLGPILEWFPGDRVDRLTVADSGSHYRDPSGVPYHHDSSSIMATTTAGRQLLLRLDVISDRPHGMNRHALQGTDACYESGRDDREGGQIWCRDLHRSRNFHPVAELLADRDLRERLLPAWFRENAEAARSSGHGGGDWHVLDRFARVVRGEIPNPCGIDAALDMTIPGLISQDPAAAQNWLTVPDSRSWAESP
jgi:predicted dehydrogenase